MALVPLKPEASETADVAKTFFQTASGTASTLGDWANTLDSGHYGDANGVSTWEHCHGYLCAAIRADSQAKRIAHYKRFIETLVNQCGGRRLLPHWVEHHAGLDQVLWRLGFDAPSGVRSQQREHVAGGSEVGPSDRLVGGLPRHGLEATVVVYRMARERVEFAADVQRVQAVFDVDVVRHPVERAVENAVHRVRVRHQCDGAGRRRVRQRSRQRCGWVSGPTMDAGHVGRVHSDDGQLVCADEWTGRYALDGQGRRRARVIEHARVSDLPRHGVGEVLVVLLRQHLPDTRIPGWIKAWADFLIGQSVDETTYYGQPYFSSDTPASGFNYGPWYLPFDTKTFAWVYAHTGTSTYKTWALRAANARELNNPSTFGPTVKAFGEYFSGDQQSAKYYIDGGTLRAFTGAHPSAYANPTTYTS